MKLLKTVQDPIEAQIIADKLRSANIFVFVRTDNEGGQMPGMNFGRGIEIMVSEVDLEVAAAIMNDKD